jgi:hypothetical protein
MLETLIPQLFKKSLEVILTLLLEKLLKWLLKEENVQSLNYFVKMQILMLYLDWVLLKTPISILEDTENNF